MRARSLLFRAFTGCRKEWPGCHRLPAMPFHRYSTLDAEPASTTPKVGAEMYAKLPPKWMAERNVLFGSAFGCTGIAVGAFAFGGVVPLGLILGSLVPMALGTVYMPRHDVQSRAIVTSTACFPIGLSAAAFLELAAWPALGTACIVIAPALAAGYSCYHVSEYKDVSMEIISAPNSPFSQLLHTVGLWNQWVPWAHQPFRDTFKLFFWYTCLGALPTACALYGGYEVWLALVLLWQYSLYFSLAAMSFGFFATSLPSMIPMEYKGMFIGILPTATRWGNWSFNNFITTAAWIYAFYAFIPMSVFFLWYKWTHGVNSSPLEVEDQRGGSLYAGQRAFWANQK